MKKWKIIGHIESNISGFVNIGELFNLLRTIGRKIIPLGIDTNEALIKFAKKDLKSMKVILK